MDQVPPSNVSSLSQPSTFLLPNDDDDRILDLIQTCYIVDECIDSGSYSKFELNGSDNNECYPVVDENNITYGKTNRGGPELYMCGYSYQIKQVNEMTTRWRCVVRTPTCPAVIHTNNIDDSFFRWNGTRHYHPPDQNRELIKTIIAKIKARVLVEPHPVLIIAEEEIRNAKMNKTQLAIMPLPYQMESTLQKHRRKNVPPLPTSLNFEIPLLYQHTWSGDRFVLADIQSKRVGGRLILFSSNEQVDLLLDSTVWFCDGTFKTVPSLFAQVYIIQCLVGDQVLPTLYALTSNRKRKTYEEIIGIIIKLAGNRQKVLAVQTIVSDYEGSWLRAVDNMLPKVSRLGCWFHFTQSCYRQIKNVGLSDLYDNEPDVRLHLRKFLALALLPHDQIHRSFKYLCKDIDPRLQSFVQYFRQQWMHDMKPHLWCVGDSNIRTNNSSEAYNRRFNSRMLNIHPNVWKFIHTLKNEERHMIQRNLHELIGDTCSFASSKRSRAKQALKKTCQIKKLHRLFSEGKKTLEQLILGLSFLVGEPVAKKKTKEKLSVIVVLDDSNI